jgi:hypothetical protein
MKKIFTYSVAVACLAIAAPKVFAQTCTPTSQASATTNPNNLGAARAVTAANGFTGTGTTSTATSMTFPAGTTSSITSPIYFFNQSQGTINFSYTLQSANPSSPVTPTITILYGAGGTSTITCTATSFTVAGSATTYYFSITPATAFPASTNFQVRLSLAIPTTNNGGRAVTATQFAINSNAVLAPAGAALPVNFTAISARKKGTGVEISWNVAGERDVLNYEIQRSTNARDFTSVGEVTATGSETYSFVDDKPANGISFYRVRNIDADGKYKYTTIVRVNLNRSIELRAYPQPAKDEITIEHANAAKGVLTLSTTNGQLIKTLQVKPGINQTAINISSLNRGLYIVRFDDGEGSIESLRIVKQ